MAGEGEVFRERVVDEVLVVADGELVILGGTAHPGEGIREGSLSFGVADEVADRLVGEVVVTHDLAQRRRVDVAVGEDLHTARVRQLLERVVDHIHHVVVGQLLRDNGAVVLGRNLQPVIGWVLV